MLKRLTAITVYSAAMGYVESAVVIYIREMAFSNTHQVFPLVYLDPRIGMVELCREAATIIMLISVGFLAGRNRLQKWLFFVYAFAIWDIFYYVVLRMVVGWPASLLSFDVLFLIPVIWIGPVVTPILISILLTVSSGILLLQSEKDDAIRIGRANLTTFVVGCSMVFFSYTEKTFHILSSQGPQGLDGYTPQTFSWLPFIVGYLIMCFAAVRTISGSHAKLKSMKAYNEPTPQRAQKA